MKTTRILCCTSSLLLALAVLVVARSACAVGNDNFASGWDITTVPYTNSSSNADATRETGEPYHYGSTNAHSVWYVWTAPSSGPMQINCGGSSIRTVVAVYTGASVSGLTSVASGRGNHLVNFAALAGTTYHIALDSLDAGAYGDFTFRLVPGATPPANDAFASATLITGSSYALSGFSNAGATKEPAEPNHADNPGGKSLWWQWTAPATGQFRLDTTGSTFDTLLAVYTGSSVGGLSLVVSNDNDLGLTSLVTFDASVGTVYLFAVDGWEGREGLVSLNLTSPTPPAGPVNDHFTNAIACSGSTVFVNGAYNTNATKEAGEPGHAGNAGGKSVWWAWTAPANGPCHVDTFGSAFNTLLAVYTGSSVSSLTQVATNDDSSMMPPASELSFSAMGGMTYYIAVDGSNGADGWITLNLFHAPVTELIFNGDFEAGNTGFSNDYEYSPGNMWPAGVYCVIKNPSSVHGAWTSFGDHTSGAGLMLVANGDSSPTNVIWRQTVNVSASATYLFSAWAASAHPSNPGQFFFFVNGRQEGNVVALPDTTGLWQNYSVIWNSGGASSALLEIRMLTTAYEGNDFVLDDLSFRAVSLTGTPPHLSIRRVAEEAAVVLSWPSVTDQLYQLQWAPTLATNQWFSLGAPVPGTGNVILLTNALEGNPQRFYRVVPVD